MAGLAAAALAAYVVAMMLSGIVLGMLGVPAPTFPGRTGGSALTSVLVGGAIVVLGLIPLGRVLGGSRGQRVVAITAFVYATYTLNTAIEASLFMRIGGTAFLALSGVLPSVAVGFVLARAVHDSATEAFGTNVASHIATLRHRHLGLRLLVAWLAFPVVYFVFGMMIAPIITESYVTGVAGLMLPPLGTIALTQLGRSAIYLSAALPILVLARSSAKGLIARLGFAYFALVGLSGLAAATFFPMLLRVTHSVEICADSFAYAAILVVLLRRRDAGEHRPSAPVPA
jgi:hypothetical protein